MRIIIPLLLFCVGMTSCEPTVDIPDQYEGRYYGYDTIITNDQLFLAVDTQIIQIYLDVVNLRDNEYDIFNSNGYWVREGLLLGEDININIEPFEGKISMTNTTLELKANAVSNGITITHSATLER
jgi:hypothetical protein